jgi:uncharacterized membrane protein YkvA (DUF1232 family)
MKNRFFKIALEQATRIGGRQRRMLLLLTRLGAKMREVNWANVRKQTAKEKFFVLGRMVKAYATGRYRNIPWKSMLLVLAMIIYFINPLDLIPDLIPMAGLTDDFAILVWVYSSVAEEIDKFLAWEASQPISI